MNVSLNAVYGASNLQLEDGKLQSMNAMLSIMEKFNGNTGTVLFQNLVDCIAKRGGSVEYVKEQTFVAKNISVENLYVSLSNFYSLYNKRSWIYPVFVCEKDSFIFNFVEVEDLKTNVMEQMTAQLPVPDLQLPSGKILTSDEFCSHPLFIHTSEKEFVFRKLIGTFCCSDNVQEYHQFNASLDLIELQNELEVKYEKYAIFSLVSFLEGKIDQEELFVINIVLEAYKEKKSIKREAVNIFVKCLDKNNVADYLKEANYPLFGEKELRNSKSNELIKLEKAEFLEKFEKLSKIKRTVVEYDIIFKGFGCERYDMSIEQSFFEIGILLSGYKNITRVSGTFILLSPELTLDLYRRSSNCAVPSLSSFNCMFGYSQDETPFLNGSRSLSFPIPLFALPNSHDYERGPKGLGMYYHDMCYHMVLEAFNPHVRIHAKIAKKLKVIAGVLFKENRVWSNATSAIASSIADREFNVYRFIPKNEAFVKSLLLTVLREAEKVFDEIKDPELSLDERIAWYKEIYAPLVTRSIHKLEPDESELPPEKLAELIYNIFIDKDLVNAASAKGRLYYSP